ncbi:MAG: hypothetical protein U1F67_01440, partial [Rubrivivax sp.]
MTAFVLLAAALALLAAAAVVAPLLAPRGTGPRGVRAAVLVVALVVGGAGAVYLARSNWNGAAPPAGAGSELTELAQRARA